MNVARHADATCLCLLLQGQERKQAGAPFQMDQCDKIFRVLGHPSTSTWPLLDALPHWQKNTGVQGPAVAVAVAAVAGGDEGSGGC
jgi:hypothetical protein